MPFIRKAIVIDPEWCAEGQSTVGAAHKHHIGRASSGRFHTGQHVDVIVSRTARAIDRQKRLSTKSYSIYSALNDGATQVNSSVSVKGRCLASDLRVAGANAVKRCAPAPTTNKHAAIGIHVEGSIFSRIGNSDRRLPGDPAICGALESVGCAATAKKVVCLVLEAVSRPVGLIDGEPLLVAATGALVGRLLHPGLTAVC